MAITVSEALDHGQSLVNDYYEQKKMMEDIDKMYFMEWDEKPSGKEYKFTTSPAARNALVGAIRLMTSTEPNFSVPFEKNNDEAKRNSEKIEKICKTIWYHSGRFRGVPLEQPAIESLLRYGMMVLAITETKELEDIFVREGASKATKRQVERLVNSTPYLVEAWDPRGVYPEWGRFGLSAVYRSVDMRLSEARQQFGDSAIQKVLSDDYKNLNEVVHYADYWDLEKHIAWITGTDGINKMVAGEPIVDDFHELPCIPIVVQTSEGSYIDSDREYQAIPFLYSVLKSGLWERQNLELTILFTNLFDLGANPNYVYKSISEDGDLELDYSVPGGVAKIRPGEDLYPLQKDVMNKDMLQGMSIADQLVEESTLYKQALGGTGNLGANTAFSTVSLLNQVGRLPLVSPQKRGGWGIGAVMETIMEMIKDKNEASTLKSKEEGFIEFDPKEIPDDLIIEANLEVDLPQDQMMQANIAQLVQQSGLASRRWVREKILNIGASGEMDKEIWDDQAAAQEYQKVLVKLAQMEMMAQQQEMQGGMGLPPEGQPRPQRPEPRGPVSPGSAMQAQAGMIPAQRPGTKPVPSMGEGMPIQEGEMPL